MMRWLRCRLGWCGGRVISAWHTDGHVWVAWQCATPTCRVIRHPEQTSVTRSHP